MHQNVNPSPSNRFSSPMIMISTHKKNVRHKRIIEFLKTQLEDYDTVDMIELVDFSEIEGRFIFDRFFRNVIEEVILFHKNEASLYEWAREVKDDNYEVSILHDCLKIQSDTCFNRYSIELLCFANGLE